MAHLSLKPITDKIMEGIDTVRTMAGDSTLPETGTIGSICVAAGALLVRREGYVASAAGLSLLAAAGIALEPVVHTVVNLSRVGSVS
jgi:hypothetical protein